MLYNELKNIEHLRRSGFWGLISIYKYLAPLELKFTSTILGKNSIRSSIFVEFNKTELRRSSIFLSNMNFKNFKRINGEKNE